MALGPGVGALEGGALMGPSSGTYVPMTPTP